MTCSVISRRSATSSSAWCPSGTVNTLMMVAPPCLPAFSASAILRLLSFAPGCRATTARSSGLGLHHLTNSLYYTTHGWHQTAAAVVGSVPPQEQDEAWLDQAPARPHPLPGNDSESRLHAASK